MFKYAFTLLLLVSCTFMMPRAHAENCTSADLPYTLNAGTLAVPTTLSTGSVIPGSTQTHIVNGSCTGTVSNRTIISCYYGTGNEVDGFPGVYATGVAGVGIELLNSSGQIIRGKGMGCNTTSTPMGTIGTDSNQTFSFSYTIKLIKTGPSVGSGTLSQALNVYGFGDYASNGINGANNVSHYSATLSQRTATCSIDPLDLTVTLGNFPVTQFTHVGSYSAWKTFTITATCSEEVNLTASVTSANGVNSQYGDVINLTPGSDSATGVGVRMLIDGVDLMYDYPIPFGGTAEPGVPMALPFSIQYYQTASTVTAGKANTVMTIDIEYK